MLSSHLRPAPYPYGLLTLRLLGKLGGKNRCFLREPLDVMPFERESNVLSLSCDWAMGDTDEGQNNTKTKSAEATKNVDTSMDEADGGDDKLNITLPLERAVEVLQLIALSSDNEKPSEMKGVTDDDRSSGIKLKWKEFRKLRTVGPDRVDIKEYCSDVVAETKRCQAEAALCVLRSALAAIIDFDEETSRRDNRYCLDYQDSTANMKMAAEGSDDHQGGVVAQRKAWSTQKVRTSTLKKICMGLMYASAIDPIKEEARSLFKGFYSHVFSLVVSLGQHILRTDSYGSRISSDVEDETTAKRETDKSSREGEDGDCKGGSYPLGCFLLTGPFVGKADPLVLNEAISEVLGGSSRRAQRVALDAIRDLLTRLRGSSKTPGKAGISDSLDDCDVFFESLISALFQASLSARWNSRSGINDGIFLLMDGLGQKWCDRFEVEAMHVAILGLKTAPRDIPVAAIQAFQFFARICDNLYKSPTLSIATVDSVILDPLLDASCEDQDGEESNVAANRASPSEDVVNMLICELASAKQIMR